MHYRSGPGVIPHPLPEVNLLMVEIPTPKPYIFMIRVSRQIKCLIAQEREWPSSYDWNVTSACSKKYHI
jgi:hypothetical protein